jgi:hypothetical protein
MLERAIEVPVEPDRAFGVWTEQVNLWWPAGHSISRHPGARMAFEARMGGRLLERSPDGAEIVWAKVVGWQPPGRVQYAFLPGGSGEYSSDVDVFFTAVPGGTRLRLRHDLGEFTPDRWASMRGRFETMWDLLLPAFQEHAATSDIPTGDDDFF